MFTTLFKGIYGEVFSNKKSYPVIDEAQLEQTLENYIMKVMGYSVISEYRRCVKSGDPSAFPYYAAVKRWFINLVQNFEPNKSRSIIDAIEEYGTNFYGNIANYKYVDSLIEGIKKFYSPKGPNPNIIIDHQGVMYKIFLVDDKSIEGMPVLVINDIEKLNNILERYVDTIVSTENYYKKIFDESFDASEKEKNSELFKWAIMNVSNDDALDLERFFEKYISFLEDSSFDYFKGRARKLGSFLDDDAYLKVMKSSYAYETPFYLAFMLCNKRVELPNVRMGIEDTGASKNAHILSIQTTQANPNPVEDPVINQEIRERLPKSPNFREFNPSHLISLVITLGLLNSMGIDKIYAYEYLPLRYQKFVNEGRKNNDELDNYQHRLTNKFMNTFFRLMEFTDGLEIISYPENGNRFCFKIKKDIKFSNDFLNDAYQLGFSQSENLDNPYKNINEHRIQG